MKRSLSILAALAAIAGLAGCASPAALVQTELTKLLPPGFSGDFTGGYKIPMYLSLQVNAEGIAQQPDGKWTFTYFEYTRDGPGMTYAHFTLGRKK